MDAQDFARPTGFGFAFSLDPAACARELRAFADAIEAGRVNLVKVHTGAGAVPEDFVLRSLMIRYVEKRED